MKRYRYIFIYVAGMLFIWWNGNLAEDIIVRLYSIDVKEELDEVFNSRSELHIDGELLSIYLAQSNKPFIMDNNLHFSGVKVPIHEDNYSNSSLNEISIAKELTLHDDLSYYDFSSFDGGTYFVQGTESKILKILESSEENSIQINSIYNLHKILIIKKLTVNFFMLILSIYALYKNINAMKYKIAQRSV